MAHTHNEVLRIREIDRHDWEIVIQKTRTSGLWRWKKVTVDLHTYRGNSSVWFNQTLGVRTGTFMESFLSDVQTAYQLKQKDQTQ